MQPSRNLIPSRSRGINYSGDVVEEWRIQADRQHGGGVSAKLLHTGKTSLRAAV
jgi:hypothetical protein